VLLAEMPHNRYFYPGSLKISEKICLDEKEAHHLIKVMRQRANETVEVMNGKGLLAEGFVETAHKDLAEIEIKSVTDGEPDNFSLVLALAFLKPQHLEFAIEKAVELGVTEIWLFPALRSEKKEVSVTYKVRLDAIVISASKQCGRLFLPKILIKKDLKTCYEKERLTFVGSPESSIQKLDAYKESIIKNRAITLCIGPESGFTPQEMQDLEMMGAQKVQFHTNTLRAETAAICGIALLRNIL
jgi:16S rRNA (uracil1498-N3)-methyltransferase